jgi:very-short-patch-repair endonuclease
MRGRQVNEDTGILQDTPALVAVMNNLRDFEIARDQGWYRIPVNRAPRRLGADYLAFYQTKIFGAEGWAVHYYAPVLRVRLARRRDLLPAETNHPHADDTYYKIEIGPLQTLPCPIPSRRLRRITFICTTLQRLLDAEEINELWLGSEEEERLWTTFRDNEITVERRWGLREEDDESYAVDFALFCRDGRVAVLCEGAIWQTGIALRERPPVDYDLSAAGWTVLRFTPYQISRSLPECVAAVQQVIAERGGLAPLPVGHSTTDWL